MPYYMDIFFIGELELTFALEKTSGSLKMVLRTLTTSGQTQMVRKQARSEFDF